jgi:phosphodiesterase/alkaline phosphatase D-like protein
MLASSPLFLETFGTTAKNPWTGTNADYPWTVNAATAANVILTTAANDSAVDTATGAVGVEFRTGTNNATDTMIATTGGIDVSASNCASAAVTFYYTAGNLTAGEGLVLQLDSGSGFTTVWSDLSGTNHGAFTAHTYNLASSELVSNLKLRFQFVGATGSTAKAHLDHVEVDGSSLTPAFDGNIVLGTPTDTSIAANVLSTDQNLNVYFKYGTSSGNYTSQTSTYALSAAAPLVVNLSGLATDTQYYYQMYSALSGGTTFVGNGEHTFHTDRAPGDTFTFDIQGDSHPERVNTQLNSDLYSRTLLTAAADHPDFYMTIGDDFSVDQLDYSTINQPEVADRYLLQRPYLGLIGNSAPLFLVNGNHEQAARYLLDGTPNNVAVWAQNARNTYYTEPAPSPDNTFNTGFYTGNTENVQFIGQLRNYFAYQWGDALFVTIDPYWSSPTCVDDPINGGPKRSNLWDVTHGDDQYNWLKTTLEQSTAKYKFVFAHHVLGTGRGGADEADSYEWGGDNANGTWGFDTNRPNWPETIQQLMVANNVTAFFQGHDHIWVHQELDGVTYQTLSEPADPNYALYNADAYQLNVEGEASNTGYTRVTISPAGVKVEYIRTFLPKDETFGRTNGMVAESYTIGAPAGTPKITTQMPTPAFPTPSDAVWITSTVTDDGSLSSVNLSYSTGAGPVNLTMYDDGLHGDGAAADGVYGSQIPAQPAGTMVTYTITATDNTANQATCTMSYVVAPSLSGTRSTPSQPAASDPVWVTSAVTNNGGAPSVILTYNTGTGSSTAVNVTMYDDGLHGDGAAGDGVYGGQVPAEVTGTTVSYYVTAVGNDGSTATSATLSYTVQTNHAPSDIVLSATTVAENLPAGTAVGTLSTTDPDTGNSFTYSLVGGIGGDDNASFTLSGSTLQTTATFNYAVKQSYSIRVRSTDQSGLYVEKAFTITITSTSAVNISGTTTVPNPPAPDAPAWVTTTVNGAVTSVQLYYSAGMQSTVFLETFGATRNQSSWTGTGVTNAWTVTAATPANVALMTGANDSAVDTSGGCGVQFVGGTSNLLQTMIATTNGIDARGLSGSVQFYVKTNALAGTEGWTFQLDSGSGYLTRLSELTGSNHGWKTYTYTLQSSELVSGLKIQFQFRGDAADDQMQIDHVSVVVKPWTMVAMADDGAHGDGAAGDHVYGGQLPGLPLGTTVQYYVAATDGSGTVHTDPATAPGTPYSYVVSYPYDIMLGRPTNNSMAVSVMSRTTVGLTFYVAYGTQSGLYSQQTSPQTLPAGSVATLELTALQPDTQYYYCIYDQVAGQTGFEAGAQEPFHTQRAVGDTFTFDVQADFHYQDTDICNPAVYAVTAADMVADHADFLIDLGDTFMTEKFVPDPTTPAVMDTTAKDLRASSFSQFGASTPLFLVTGNHDSELGWMIDPAAPTDNRAVWSTTAREEYFPSPVPGGFYSGATTIDPYVQEARNSYYSFTWGSAQFIVLDPFWYTDPKPAAGGQTDCWGWTLGDAQYHWLEQTLATSTSQFKFVFIHHLVGGSFDGIARGGVEFSKFFEWGGYNQDGTWGFGTRRPGWDMPIQNLLLTYGVNVVFHGHDHLFVKQDLDANGDGATDMVYLECPQPANENYYSTSYAASYGYANYSSDTAGDSGLQGSSGYVRVTVGAISATLDYVRSFAVADQNSQRVNGSVAYRFTLDPPTDLSLSGGTVAKNQPQGTLAGIFSTIDFNADDTFTYTLVSGNGDTDNALFTIDGDQLKTVVAFGADANGSYSIRVRSTDHNALWTEKAFVISITDAPPAVRSWDGDGNDANWTTGANWETAAGLGWLDSPVFPAPALQTTNTNDFPDDTAFGSLTFSGVGYVISGNRIVLLDGINSSILVGQTNRLALDIGFASGTASVVTDGGSLRVEGAVSNDGVLTVAGTGLLQASSIIGSGSISVAPGATLNASYIKQHSLRVAPGSKVVLGGLAGGPTMLQTAASGNAARLSSTSDEEAAAEDAQVVEPSPTPLPVANGAVSVLNPASSDTIVVPETAATAPPVVPQAASMAAATEPLTGKQSQASSDAALPRSPCSVVFAFACAMNVTETTDLALATAQTSTMMDCNETTRVLAGPINSGRAIAWADRSKAYDAVLAEEPLCLSWNELAWLLDLQDTHAMQRLHSSSWLPSRNADSIFAESDDDPWK